MSRDFWVRCVIAIALAVGVLSASPAAQANYDGGTGYPAGSSCVIEAVQYPLPGVDTVPSLPLVNSVPPALDTCFDPAGTQQDELVGLPSDGRFFYGIGDINDSSYQPVTGSGVISAGGSTVVYVNVFDNGGGSGQSGMSTTQFRLTFPNLADVTPADNIYSVEIGPDCLKDSGGTYYRTMTTSTENVADLGLAYVPYVKAVATTSSGGFATEGEEATRVMDGTSTGNLAVKTTVGDREGVRSGLTWEVKFKVRDVPGGTLYTAHTETVDVGPCPGDTVVTPLPKLFPKAKIIRRKAHALQVSMDKGSTSQAWFRVKTNPPKKKAWTKPYKVTTKKPLKKWRTHLRYGTKIVVKAYFKKWGKWKWWTVKRYTVRRIGS